MEATLFSLGGHWDVLDLQGCMVLHHVEHVEACKRAMVLTKRGDTGALRLFGPIQTSPA